MATNRSAGYAVSAAVWNAVLSSINDAGTIWSGTVSGTVAATGVITSSSAGGHGLTNSSNAALTWGVHNVNAGASATGAIVMDNDARSNNLTLRSYSNAAGASIPDISDSVLLRSNGVGGLTLSAQNPSGIIRFVLSTTMRASYDASGNYSFGSTGNITDAIATPTIASGFGSGSTIAGKAYAFKITTGSSASVGVVNFNTTYATAPICVASYGNAGSSGGHMEAVASTTQLTITIFSTTWANGSVINVLVRGF